MDAIVVGSGPNGVAAGITLARAGRQVRLLEASAEIGGGARTAEVTLAGFHHDVCSTVQGMAQVSPFLRSLPLDRHGVELVTPDVPLAHLLDDHHAILLYRSIDETVAQFDPVDAEAYRRLMEPLIEDADKLWNTVLGPLPIPPRHPIALATLGVRALWPARMLLEARFRNEAAKALIAGAAAHSLLSLDEPGSAAIGLMLLLAAHTGGWPFVKGGTERYIEGMAEYFRALGGEIETDHPVMSLDEFDSNATILLSVTPRQALPIVGDRWPARYRRQLNRFQYGFGSFKVDWALDAPIPWAAAEVALAGTVHLGGTLETVAHSERVVACGGHPERPFILLTQPTLFDPSRAPVGKHIAWGYCHVPNGSTTDMLERIEREIEHYAPGFRERILARHVTTPADLERYNANYIGGDVNGGRQHLWQQFMRPAPRLNPYTTPDPRIFFCGSSTPPGGGVHGMSGYHAAKSALKRWR